MPQSVILTLVAVVAWLLGGIPCGYLIGRAKGVDIRQHGSGNIGATNVWRVLGKSWGTLCFVLDFLKGLLPVLAAAWVAARWLPAGGAAGAAPAATLVAALAAVAGHIWTPYLRFRGGKGVATAAGAMCGLAPASMLAALGVWLAVMVVDRRVGLASICAAIALPCAGLAWRVAHPAWAPPRPVLAVLFIVGLLALYRHRTNLERLLQGTEPRLGEPARKTPDADRHTQ